MVEGNARKGNIRCGTWMAIRRTSRFTPTSIYRSTLWMESRFLIWTHSRTTSCLCPKSLSEPKIWEQNNDTKRIVTKEAEGNLTTTEAEQLKQMKKFPLRKLFANKK